MVLLSCLSIQIGAIKKDFCREVDGKLSVGEIKEKEKAKVDYEDAKERDCSAAHVAHR